jgi:hypothetical protein
MLKEPSTVAGGWAVVKVADTVKRLDEVAKARRLVRVAVSALDSKAVKCLYSGNFLVVGSIIRTSRPTAKRLTLANLLV